MRPLLRASATSGCLYILGDIINQYLFHDQFDLHQTMRFGNQLTNEITESYQALWAHLVMALTFIMDSEYWIGYAVQASILKLLLRKLSWDRY